MSASSSPHAAFAASPRVTTASRSRRSIQRIRCPGLCRAQSSTRPRKGMFSASRLKGRTTRVRSRCGFPRQDQIARGDAEFWARLEKDYEKVKITAQPMRFFGDFRSDVEEPGIAADEVRVRLMRHFPDGPGMAAAAQQAANRYARALQKWLEKEGERRPKPSELARRWGMFCHDHGNAEREYYEAGYRPALVDPYAIDFSEVKLTGRERKAAWRDRSAGRERDHDHDR